MRFHERIELPGEDGKARPIGEKELVDVLTRTQAINDGDDITQFEITTAAAFLAFAEHKARLVIQSPEESPEITALGAVLAETACDIKFYNAPVGSTDDAVRLAQNAAQAFGGLDTVINIICFSSADLAGARSVTEVENLVADKLLPATLITRVAANRMRLTLTEGSILNVVLCPVPANGAEAALIGVIRAALAAMTRGEAKEWAGEAIRINAIGPRSEATVGAVLSSEPDIAYLGLQLASKKGRQLTGHVFDAEGVASQHC